MFCIADVPEDFLEYEDRLISQLFLQEEGAADTWVSHATVRTRALYPSVKSLDVCCICTLTVDLSKIIC